MNEEFFNFTNVTLEDCLRFFELYNLKAVICDGEVIGFEKENN